MRCRYCGRFAGLFSGAHKKCESRHSLALERMHELLRQYFRGETGVEALKTDLPGIKNEGHLSEEEVCNSMNYAVRAFADSVCVPVPQEKVDAMRGFLMSFKDSVSYDCLQYAASCFAESYIEERVSVGSDAEKVWVRIDGIFDLLGISRSHRQMVLKSAFCSCAEWMMRCKEDSAGMRCRFFCLCGRFGIDVLSLAETEPDNELLKTFCQLLVVDGLVNVDSQSVIWTYGYVEVFDVDDAETGKGYPLLKGLTYKPGQFKGRPFEIAGKEPLCTGKLEVYPDRLRLVSEASESEVMYADVVRAVPYSDSVALETESRQMIVRNVDAWFLMSLFNLS